MRGDASGVGRIINAELFPILRSCNSESKA